MQSSFESLQKNSFKRIFQNRERQIIDSTFDFISPWNNSTSRAYDLSPPRYPPSASKTKIETFNSTQGLRRIHVKNLRIKTEQPAYSPNHFTTLTDKDEEKNTNFFAMSFIKEKTGSDAVKKKKNYNTKTRLKFKTPVVNINQYSFTPKLGHQRFQSIIKPSIFNEENMFKKTKQNFQTLEKDNFFVSSGLKKPQLRKFLTQKLISFHRSPLTKLSFKKICKNGWTDPSESLPECLKKIMKSQIEPVIKKVKSKSLNKFNKTFY